MTNSIILEQLTRDDLKGLISEVIRQELTNHKQVTPESEPRKPLSQNEAAKYFGKTRQTVTSWRKKGIIKGHNINGRIFFFQDELETAISKV